MASIGFLEIMVAIISLGLIYHFSMRKSAKPWSLPVLGMLPMLLFNLGQLFDKLTQLLDLNNGTFPLKGAWFASRDMIITSNPANVHHIMSKNFSNYPKGVESKRIFMEVLNKLVYLHGALCESLRLYPPISLQRRVVIGPDILPSGHHVDPGTKVVICLYAMGRMKFIWGEDCYELAFGKLKSVAAAIIHNYHVEVVKSGPAVPESSIAIHMKDGLKVKLTKIRD